MSQIIARPALLEIVDRQLAAGVRVVGPRRMSPQVDQGQALPRPRRKNGAVLFLYRPLAAAAELLLDPAEVRPANSIKETVFPRHEKLYGYRLRGREIELVDLPPDETEQVVIAARPCDAAALPILDHVFRWDYRDPFYENRRQRCTVVTLACADHDSHCFCTSVGLGPQDPKGSDAMLLDLGNGTYEVRTFSEKGARLFAGQTQQSDRVAAANPGPEKMLDQRAIHRFLEHSFTRTEWQLVTLRCQGCGACAYHCPTCHCFDMVDEGNVANGAKVRNWDACQYAMFTMHASGHNPRANQSHRQRQRVYHKFQIYPEKFGEVLCTGCGNCTRACPVQLGIRPVLESMQKAVKK